jgi:hypothetical protein
MSTKPSAGRFRQKYELIKAHRSEYSVQMMCRVLGVAPSGNWEWLQQPVLAAPQRQDHALATAKEGRVVSGVVGEDPIVSCQHALGVPRPQRVKALERTALLREQALRPAHGLVEAPLRRVSEPEIAVKLGKRGLWPSTVCSRTPAGSSPNAATAECPGAASVDRSCAR